MVNLIQILQKQLVETETRSHPEAQRVLLKEILQAYVLDFIYNHSTFRSLNFYGGTCLHVVYGLNRLSEDIDLDNQAQLDLSTFPAELNNFCQNTLDYPMTYTSIQKSKAGILRIVLKFPVLKQLGLSMHEDETLHLKIEISHHKQIAEIEHTPIFFYGKSFVPAHFSLPTMMSGKMLTCIERNFEKGTSNFKGRDFYDLLWLMERKVQPLEEKLEKDGEIAYSKISAFMAIEKKVDQISISALRRDLLPLFESAQFLESWLNVFKERFLFLLKEYIK
ncbi:MAG TPA: hypothetical protein DCK95_09470 [Anaerolineaceae bacterium]|nr:hypothetical protein [Anaerolineaceae bacterium]